MTAQPGTDLTKLSRYKSVFSEREVKLLEEEYTRSNIVDFTTSTRLAQEIGKPEVVIRSWFQNKRARTKRLHRKQAQPQYLSQLLPCPDNIGQTLIPNNIGHSMGPDKIGQTLRVDQEGSRLTNVRCQAMSSHNSSTGSHGSQNPDLEINPGSKIRAVFNLQRSDSSGRGHTDQGSSGPDLLNHPDRRNVPNAINTAWSDPPERRYDINREYPQHESIPYSTQFYPSGPFTVILPDPVRSRNDLTAIRSKSNVERSVGIYGRLQQVEPSKHVQDDPEVRVKQEPSETDSAQDDATLSQEKPLTPGGGDATMSTARSSSTARQTPTVSSGQVQPTVSSGQVQPETITDHCSSESSNDPNTDSSNIPNNAQLSELQMNKLMSAYEEAEGNVDIPMSQKIACDLELPFLQVQMWFQIRKQMEPRIGQRSVESCPELQSDGPRTVPGGGRPSPQCPVGGPGVKERTSTVPGPATDPDGGSSHSKTGGVHRKSEQISHSLSSIPSVNASRMSHGIGGQTGQPFPPSKTTPAPSQNSGTRRVTMQNPQFYTEGGCVFSVSPEPSQPTEDSSSVKRKSCVKAKDWSRQKLAKTSGNSKGKPAVKAAKQTSRYSPSETVGRSGNGERKGGTDQVPWLVQYDAKSSDTSHARQTLPQGQGDTESIFQYFSRGYGSRQQSSDQNVQRPNTPHTATSRVEFQISTLMNAYEEMSGEVDIETLSRLGHILDLPFLQVERWFQIRRQMDPRRRPERHSDDTRPPQTHTVACPPRVSSADTNNLDILTSLKNLANIPDRQANRSGVGPERDRGSRGGGQETAVSRTDSAVGGPRPRALAAITGSEKPGAKRTASTAQDPAGGLEVGLSRRTDRSVQGQTELRTAVWESLDMQSIAKICDNFQLRSKKSEFPKISAARIPSNMEPMVHHGAHKSMQVVKISSVTQNPTSKESYLCRVLSRRVASVLVCYM